MEKRSFLKHLSNFFREIFSSSLSLNGNNYAKHLYDAHEQQLPKKTHIAMSKIATPYNKPIYHMEEVNYHILISSLLTV